MRIGVALSLAAHLLMWAYLAFASPRPFTGVPPQAIEVAIVSANEAPPVPQGDGQPPAPQPAPPAPAPPPVETKPDSKPDLSALVPELRINPPAPKPQPQTQTAALPPQAPPPPPPAQQPSQSSPQPEQAIPDAASLAEMLMLPNPKSDKDGFDGQAERSAKLTASDIAAFKSHLKTCAKIPEAVGTDRNLKIVIRVALKPDGALASPPTLIAASASPHGPVLVNGAIAALKACQPFLELPAAKYKEWKVLDVTLRPQDLVGG